MSDCSLLCTDQIYNTPAGMTLARNLTSRCVLGGGNSRSAVDMEVGNLTLNGLGGFEQVALDHGEDFQKTSRENVVLCIYC